MRQLNPERNRPRVSRHAIVQIGREEFERVRRDGAVTLSPSFTPGMRWHGMFECAMAAVHFGDVGTVGQTVIIDLWRHPDLSDEEIIEKAREAKEPYETWIENVICAPVR